jgi:protein involved in polysaccharide export with SLBB domain
MLKGKRRNDALLDNRDTIFVPRIGSTIALTGAVAHPAIYELKGETRLAEALALAGGELPQGNARRVHLRRFDSGREFVVKDLDGGSPVAVQNGDLVEVGFIEQAVNRSIRLAGHVWYPNVVDFRPGLTLADVLTGPDILKPEAVTDFGLLYRYDEATTRYRVETFPLSKVFQAAYDTPLRPADTIVVLSRAQFGMSEPVTLRGAVWKDGEFPYTPGLTLVDLLAMGGGIRFGADVKRIEVSRKVAAGAEASPVETEHFRLDLAQARTFPLQPFENGFRFYRKYDCGKGGVRAGAGLPVRGSTDA